MNVLKRYALAALLGLTFYNSYSQSNDIFQATKSGNIAQVQALIALNTPINQYDDLGHTPLHYAAQLGHLDIVLKLINAHANIDARSIDNATPLFFASKAGHIQVIKALIHAHADVNAKTNSKLTPLLSAVQGGHRQTVKILLDANAQVDPKWILDATPLHFAAERGDEAIIRVLVLAGAHIDAATSLGLTPLHIAASNNDAPTVRLLVQLGADPAKLDRTGKSPILLTNNAEIINFLSNIPNLSAQLHKAIDCQDITTIDKLIAQGAPLTMPNTYGDTPIHRAIGTYDAQNPTQVDKIARMLIRILGARNAIMLKGRYRQTPLHIAAQQGNMRIAGLLISLGADVNAQDGFGNTPLHYARTFEIHQQLMRHGADVSVVNHEGQNPIAWNIQVWTPLFEYVTKNQTQQAGPAAH